MLQQLEVSWLSESPSVDGVPPKNGTESPADIVLRLMALRQDKALSETNETIPPQPAGGVAPFTWVESRRETRSISWKDRLRSWTRCVVPASKDPESEPSPLHLTTVASLPEISKTYRGVRNITTATFGHILHNHARRILSPFIPHPASFSSLKADNDEPLVQSTFIILNFTPQVDKTEPRNSFSGKRRPNLRLRLPVDADANLSDFSLPKNASFQVVAPLQFDDLLLADYPVDVRLAHHRVFPLNVNQLPLQNFLANSEFNLLAGRLRTPSRATFEIPTKMLEPEYSGRLPSKADRNVPYLFHGLEIHQTVEMAWRGHTIRYSSIEAGQHGGQRQEITLQFGRPRPAARIDFQAENRTEFLQCVEDIVTGKVFSWNDGYKAMKEKQFEDYSYDLPSEELGEDFVVTEMTEDDIKKEVELARRQMINDEFGLPEEEDAADEELDDISSENNLEHDTTSRWKKREEDALDREIDAMLNLNAHEKAEKAKKTESMDTDLTGDVSEKPATDNQ